MENEFTTVKKSQPVNWVRMHNTLLAAADILKSTKFDPSRKQQVHMIGLLEGIACQVYETESRNLNKR
jgi:hypothetical protein